MLKLVGDFVLANPTFETRKLTGVAVCNWRATNIRQKEDNLIVPNNRARLERIIAKKRGNVTKERDNVAKERDAYNEYRRFESAESAKKKQNNKII
jgi:hypothetical protein